MRPFDPADVAQGAMNRCCAGNLPPTLWRLLRFECALVLLALSRLVSLCRNNPRRLVRRRAM